MTNVKRALIIVDVQNDFCPGGALPVENGDAVAHDIYFYASEAKPDRKYDLIVASRDWHRDWSSNGGHFAHKPDFVNTWPVHCVAGTQGAQYANGLYFLAKTSDEYQRPPSWVDVEILKGQGGPAYSAFEGINEDGLGLDTILTSAEISSVDVCGLALDYCVKKTALHAFNGSFHTRVLVDLTASVNPTTALLGERGIRTARRSGLLGDETGFLHQAGIELVESGLDRS